MAVLWGGRVVFLPSDGACRRGRGRVGRWLGVAGLMAWPWKAAAVWRVKGAILLATKKMVGHIGAVDYANGSA